jgi:mono/diheme cytochrome c family protein
MKRGDAIYKELCFSCHGDDGRGAPMPGATDGSLMGPPLAGSTRVQGHREYVIKTLLHGMTGPVDGRTYSTGVMAPMGTNPDDWIAAVGSYVRNAFGNVGSFITASDVARVRAASPRTSFWTVEELVTSLPQPLTDQAAWKATASHNPASAPGAFNFGGWTSAAPQEPGMWFAVELPEPRMLTEIEFVSAGGGFGGGRGRGRGGRGGPTPGGAYPRGYKVEVSTDGAAWTLVAEGKGTGQTTLIAFDPVAAKHVRLTQTDATENAPVWSIQRLRLYEVREKAGSQR